MYALTCKRFQRAVGSLKNFRRHALYGDAFPAAVEAKGHAIIGTVYSYLNSQDLARLDIYEGWLYRRRRVLSLREGQLRVTWVYTLKPALRHRLRSLDWDKSDFLARRCRVLFFRNFGRTHTFFRAMQNILNEAQHGQI